MRTEANFIDYGIYIDRKKAIIISLSHVSHEALVGNRTIENPEYVPRTDEVSEQEHLQHSRKEELKKFSRLIISYLDHPHSILVFGPAATKYELQQEIRHTKRLKNVPEALLVTDVMEENEAVRFVKDHFHPISAGQQIFTGVRHS